MQTHHNADLIANKLTQLKQILPEVFSENQLDIEKLKLVLGEQNTITHQERYHLNWAGKANAYHTLQSATSNTLIPVPQESVNFDSTHNIFIEAENLEALKILQKSYANSIKMIYIDPPYNTGSDQFIYPDKYSETRDEYARRVGDKDDNGYLLRDGVFVGAMRKNSKDSGHYHSNWLNMMLPRLHLAKNLLSDDGVIFISIDDHEQAQLKLLCDEVFGSENFVADIIWANKEGGGSSDSKNFRTKHEYILCYAKNKDSLVIHGLAVEDVDRYKLSDEYESIRGKYQLIKLDSASIQYSSSLDYIIKAPDGTDIKAGKGIIKSCWRWSKAKFDWGIEHGFIEIKKDREGDWAVYTKQYLNCDSDGNIVARTLQPIALIEKFSTTQSNKDLKQILGDKIFSYSKPYQLIEFLMKISLKKNDIILDFFAGSSSTAHAVMQLNAEDGGNRQFICVQLPEQTDEKSEAYKAGFSTIAEISKERIRRAGTKIQAENPDKQLDTGFKVFKLTSSHFKQWQNINQDNLEQALELFAESPLVDNANDMGVVYELLLRLGLKLTVNVSEQNGVYWLNDGEKNKRYALVLREIANEEFLNIIAQKPAKVVALDSVFYNDASKTNVILQFKDAKIELETI